MFIKLSSYIINTKMLSRGHRGECFCCAHYQRKANLAVFNVVMDLITAVPEEHFKTNINPGLLTLRGGMIHTHKSRTQKPTPYFICRGQKLFKHSHASVIYQHFQNTMIRTLKSNILFYFFFYKDL